MLSKGRAYPRKVQLPARGVCGKAFASADLISSTFFSAEQVVCLCAILRKHGRRQRQNGHLCGAADTHDEFTGILLYWNIAQSSAPVRPLSCNLQAGREPEFLPGPSTLCLARPAPNDPGPLSIQLAGLLLVKTANQCQRSCRHLAHLCTEIAQLLILLVQGLLTAASKTNGEYRYNFATVPLLAELLKLCISSYLFARQKRQYPEAARATKRLRTALLFLVPSIIYWIHNNVQFLTLKLVDPATYQILGNLKIVSTGVLFWIFLKRRLTFLQWQALALLTIGATTSQV